MVERVRLEKARPRVRLNTTMGGLQRPLPPVTPFKEMGGTGTAVFGGFVQRKDKSAQWFGKERYTISSEILANVSIVAASVRYFLNLVSHPNWAVVPASDSEEDKMYAEFVEDVIHDMDVPFQSTVRRAASYLFHGFGIQEWTAKKREDGKIGLESLEPRMQHTIERWEVDEKGTILGVWQRSPQTHNLLGLPRSKMVYLVDDTFTDSPEGFGIFRNLLEPYNRFKQYLTLEARTFERDLRGIPIGRLPLAKMRELVQAGSLTQAQYDEIVSQMQSFVELQVKDSNTGLLLDSMPYESEAADGMKISSVYQYTMELLQGTGNGLPELAGAIDRLQREMARIIGTEHLMMGDQGGNRALAVDKSRNLYLVANATLSGIAEAYDKDIITPIWTLNGFPVESRPRFQAEDVSFKDVGQITAAIRDMATAGAVLAPDDPAIDDVRDLLGISRYDGVIDPTRMAENSMAASEAAIENLINPPADESGGSDSRSDETGEPRRQPRRRNRPSQE